MNLAADKDPLFVKTVLGRAKGSALDISSSRLEENILALLSPHTQKFRSLELVFDHWGDIQEFSKAFPGPLPLLDTLEINMIHFDVFSPGNIDPPSLPLFSGAVNLKKFLLHTKQESYLNHFTFPNLTTFELRAMPQHDEFPASELLDFLEATPTLETVHIAIEGGISFADVPPGSVVVLPNAKSFSVTRDEPDQGLAGHISCPFTRRTSLVYERDIEAIVLHEAFPTPPSWIAIGPHHIPSTIDEVVLAITPLSPGLSCSLFFLSPGPADLELGYRVVTSDEDYSEPSFKLGEKHSKLFSQAFRAAQTYPHLGNVKRVRILDSNFGLAPSQLALVMREVLALFERLSPLEELLLDVDDLRPFLFPFIDLPDFRGVRQLDMFPPIKRLTIIERSDKPFDGKCAAAIVRFAKSQHTRGVPFERVTLRMTIPPVGMAERLEPWVGALHFSEGKVSTKFERHVM